MCEECLEAAGGPRGELRPREADDAVAGEDVVLVFRAVCFEGERVVVPFVAV